ncbi:MAG: sn-glycerol-3-phosphate ABC transporter substrate-binding protein UgpB [Kiloniellaceae bacterium]|nr:sn-glycerol-3-phosphate ABC transporter substrate-binding protein UgpB [Kiloniellaceae bacterium]
MRLNRNAILLAAALSFAGSFAQPAAAATEIQFWHAFTGPLGEILAKQVEGFNASESDYQVVAVYKGNYSEALNAGVAAFRAKQQPHILQVFEVGTATMMAAKGAVNPVFEVMKAGGETFDPAVYLPTVTGYYTDLEGNMLSMPYNSSTPVLYYNKEAFQAAGLDPESPPKTWQEFGAALDALQASGSVCPFTTTWQSWVHLENFSAWHNVPFATQANGFGGLDTTLVFNGPTQVRHIQQLGDWARDGKFVYGGRRNESGARFNSGECAMLTESSAGYASIKAQTEFDFGVSSLPYWDDADGAPQNTIIGGASLWVLTGHPQEEYEGVAKFFSYLSSPEVQAEWHQQTGYLPITHAAYDLTKEQGFYEQNPGTETALIQMTAKAPTENSKGVRLGSFDQIRGIIDEELEAVWAGTKSAQEALDSAVERGNVLLRRFERANN